MRILEAGRRPRPRKRPQQRHSPNQQTLVGVVTRLIIHGVSLVGTLKIPETLGAWPTTREISGIGRQGIKLGSTMKVRFTDGLRQPRGSIFIGSRMGELLLQRRWSVDDGPNAGEFGGAAESLREPVMMG